MGGELSCKAGRSRLLSGLCFGSLQYLKSICRAHSHLLSVLQRGSCPRDCNPSAAVKMLAGCEVPDRDRPLLCPLAKCWPFPVLFHCSCRRGFLSSCNSVHQLSLSLDTLDMKYCTATAEGATLFFFGGRNCQRFNFLELNPQKTLANKG